MKHNCSTACRHVPFNQSDTDYTAGWQAGYKWALIAFRLRLRKQLELNPRQALIVNKIYEALNE
jgi:hypothetical protein